MANYSCLALLIRREKPKTIGVPREEAVFSNYLSFSLPTLPYYAAKKGKRYASQPTKCSLLKTTEIKMISYHAAPNHPDTSTFGVAFKITNSCSISTH